MKILQVALAYLVISCSVALANDLIISESNDNSITLEFSLQGWEIKEVNINGKLYTSVRFSKDEIITKPGQPMAPCRISIIGVPLDAKIDYQLIELIPERRLKGKLIPTPTFLPDQQYNEDPIIYNGSQSFPSNIIQLEKPGFIRNQRVSYLKLFPLQFFPKANEIQLIKKIVVKLTFSGRKGTVNTGAIDRAEFLYQQTILNYHQAKAWRKHPIKKSLNKRKISLSDNWYKIYLKKEGIYKITGKFLSNHGIDINTIEPSTIRIYNDGGRELPRALYTPRPDSLIENAILVIDNNDGKFDESDYILFYGKSIQGWNYDSESKTFFHYINHYTYENVYWLTWGNNVPGKRMKSVSLPLDDKLPLQTSFWDHVFLEEEYYNPIDSGIDWYGKAFTSGGEELENRTFIFNLKGARPQDSTIVNIKVAGISAGNHLFQFFMNEHYLGNTSFYNYSSKYAIISTNLFTETKANILIDGYNKLRIRYSPYANYSKAYLDWVEIHFWRELKANENELFFSAPLQAGSYRYQLSNFSENDIFIFDISNYYDVRQFTNFRAAEGGIVFVDTVNSNSPKRYLALSPSNFRAPERMEKDIPSDLRASTHQADFIIITHDDFYDQALPLKSLRENCDNLKTEVVKISDVYDEFSWGLFDPVAIRDFIKYAYENWAIQPSYVLLFGSGDFDYRNIIDPIDHNWIPPFQTTDNYEGYSRTRDDWYVCVSGEDDYLDLSIGRLPVRNPDQAQNVIKKIIDYKNSPQFGDWRNTITIVADDVSGEYQYGIEREHTEQSEDLAENYVPKSFNVNKIYLVEYPPVYTASITGVRKPAAQQDIIEAINRGCLIINYIGHGRYDLWAHEVVLMMDQDLQRINNGRKQAFWIAATCYFGRFDNPAYESMSEELILLEDNGAIAVFSAARLVGSAPNASLNKLLFSKLFPSAYRHVRLGDAVAMAKNARGNTENDQKTLLFGDPTLYLNNPSIKVKITDVVPDTIKALGLINVSGEIQQSGHDISGQILLKAFDSRKYRTYIIDDNNTLNYWLPGNSIFRGTATVSNGRFNVKFIVPKDITYGGQSGRFSVYFWNDEIDGSGYRGLIPVGGTEKNFNDLEGPQITIRFNGVDFYDSGFTNENPVLNLEISDSTSGINITGEIGHNITLVLDEQKENLTDYFNYYNNSYTFGSINYALGPFKEGPHNISVKAWDNSNNSSEVHAEFIVVATNRLVLQNVLNFPNPFSTGTEFTFRTNQVCDATIKIYTITGRLIKKIDNIPAINGFNHLYWDGSDEDGDPLANGVYLYKIYAKSQYQGKTISTEVIEKLMIIR